MDEREKLKAIYDAAVRAVAPDRAVLTHVRVENGTIIAGNKKFPIPEEGVYVVGAGKGAGPMAQSVEELLGDHIREGFVVVKYGHKVPLKKIEIAEAAHPLPDDASVMAARRIREIAGKVRNGGMLICIFTGGASALFSEPIAPITHEEWIETNRLLLGCGASIDNINCIRRALTTVGGGKLAALAYDRPVLTLLVSDVPQDEIMYIASGPTINDDGGYSSPRFVAENYNIFDSLPDTVQKVLKSLDLNDGYIFWEEGEEEEEKEDSIIFDDVWFTPRDLIEDGIIEPENPIEPVLPDYFFKNVSNLIVANNRQALEAAAKEAGALGYAPVIHEYEMSQEAQNEAANLVKKALKIQKRKLKQPVCLLAGGETTVAIKGEGKGGRNQEMALAAAIRLSGKKGICALFSGTDGTDGPTDAAGGFAFPDTVEKMGGATQAKAWLKQNDSNTALKKAGDLFVTGPTLTNVMDIAIILIEPRGA